MGVKAEEEEEEVEVEVEAVDARGKRRGRRKDTQNSFVGIAAHKWS